MPTNLSVICRRFSFHIADDMCKKLSAGQFTYSFDYAFVGPAAAASGAVSSSTRSLSTPCKGYTKPEPKRAATATRRR